MQLYFRLSLTPKDQQFQKYDMTERLLKHPRLSLSAKGDTVSPFVCCVTGGIFTIITTVLKKFMLEEIF